MRMLWRTMLIGAAVVAVVGCDQPAPFSPSAPMSESTGTFAQSALADAVDGHTAISGRPLSVETGNGAPSGSHYNLNIIGVPKNKKVNMTGGSGHRIFVPLWGTPKILLKQGTEFAVLDANGTDGQAVFQLPNPDPDGDGTTVYSVFARALGTPGGKSLTTTCATDPVDGSEICSVMKLTLKRTTGKSTFLNVSKDLLYIYADVNDDGILDRVPLFDSRLVGYFWNYDNQGLKLAQLRFYDCSTTVPDASDPNGPQTTACFQ
jgi:hypothetical protein